MALPDTYKQVEYIQSDGNQIIDTGVYGNGNTSILTKMVVTGRKGNYDMYYGAYGDSGISAFFIQSNYPYNNKLRVVNYSNDDSTRKYVDSINNLQFNTEYIIEHTNTKFTINGTLQGTMASSSFTTPQTLCMFGVHGKTGNLGPSLIGKVYYFKIYESGNIVRDFVPVIRKSDNKPGLYDLVNDQFYTNAGTGEFSYKEYAESGKIQKIYIGVNQSRPGEVIKTYTLSNGVSFYIDGYKPKSIIYELDYYNQSSVWTGCTLKIGNGSETIGWYIWGGQNIGTNPNSDGKIEKNTTKVYDSTHKYISAGSTNHLKITFTREGISIKVGSNAEETYLYSSGTWGPTALSIMDSATLQAAYGASSGSTLSNGVATVTYEPV